MVKLLQKPLTNDKINLIFFPFAGGSGEYYHHWLAKLAPNISGQYAQLPGRGRYFEQPAYGELPKLCQHLAAEISLYPNSEIAFFGHSMGALIAFELAKMLQEEYELTTRHLFLSGHRAPSEPYQRALLHKLNEEQLVEQMRHMGGIDNQLGLEDLKPFLPTLYQDFRLCETYQHSEHVKLASSMHILYGEQDEWINKETLEKWQLESHQKIIYHPFPGNHFYLTDRVNEITRLINHTLGGTDVNCK
ncbi:thioesterase [Legionella israelensis]|uniref:thioesterase II family protein n=1 Tax=Legionella israelensis TaxID=454 RepID=UPI001180E056|nr:thioesterase domain-containing protein [Legionella israelensis]QDP73285.1 thioesterase [Legionella israelensis]